MKLNTFNRTAKRKSDANLARREGKVPAALYRRGKDSEPLSVDAAEFNALLRNVKKGRLATSKITLIDEKGKERIVIIKDIQYHPTTYNVIHLDFEELIKDVPVNVNIPIEFTGVADCVGVKLGGVIRQVIRQLRVRCLPKDLPEAFTIDVKSLAMKESKRLSDIKVPKAIRALADLNEVAVVIAKR